MAAKSKDIISAWKSEVWDKMPIRGLCPNAFSRDVLADQDSLCELAAITHCGKINFAQYFVQRYRQDDRVGCCGRQLYRVRVEYYKEDSDTAWNEIQEFFEVLDDTVQANLGYTWDSTVDNFERQRDWPLISNAGTLDGRIVWGGRFDYFAESSQNCE